MSRGARPSANSLRYIRGSLRRSCRRGPGRGAPYAAGTLRPGALPGRASPASERLWRTTLRRLMTGYSIIDVDTHVTEPADTWTSRVPASMRDRVPQVAKDARGRDIWVIDGHRVSLVGLLATAGRGDFMQYPSTFEDLRPAAYDPKARLQYMDEMGIWAMVMYPNVAGFGSQQFLKMGDPELMLACVEAYNNFQTEWASADPRRLLPITSTPFWDIDASVRVVRRCAEMGHKGILFTGEPHKLGQPMLGDHAW